MFRRTSTLLCAAVIGAAAIVGVAAGTATADPSCPDFHWFGAAGSGERDGDPTANGGMGRVVMESYRDIQRRLQRDGRTITAEPVEYPAVAVPVDGDILGWAGFIGSVDTGTAALERQYTSYVERCPDSKVVLAGYSQGAMVVHRNLVGLAASPNLAAALLIADGYRLPHDTTLNMGSVTAVPGAGMGVGQDWPILAHAPTDPLPPILGSRTISVCDLGDPVCDYDPDSTEVTPAGVNIHTSYAVASTGRHAWTEPLYRLLGPAPTALQVELAGA